MHNIAKTKKLNNKGVTLVEMILVCLFVGMISLMVAQTVVFSYRMSTDISLESYASNVSEMILDHVSGIINQAKAPGDRQIYFSNDKRMIAFEVANSSPVIIYTSDNRVTPIKKADTADQEFEVLSGPNFSGTGYLNIYYCQLNNGNNTNPASLWNFPESSYMGYEIKSLTFTPVTHNKHLAVFIELTIRRTDGKGADFTASTTAKCYNVEKADDYSIDSVNNDNFAFDFIQTIWKKPNEDIKPDTPDSEEEIPLTNEAFTAVVNRSEHNTKWTVEGDKLVHNKGLGYDKSVNLLNEAIQMMSGYQIIFKSDKYNYTLYRVENNEDSNINGFRLLEEIDVVGSLDGKTITIEEDSWIVINVIRKDDKHFNQEGELLAALESVSIKKNGY